MPTRTQLFQQLPWTKGLNTSIDASLIGPDALTVADNIVFDTRGSRKMREGINFNWDSGAVGTTSIIKLHDLWYGSSTRTQKIVGIASDCKVYSYSGGTRTLLTDAGVAWTGTITNASTLTFFNKLIMVVNGSGNVMKEWDGSGSIVDVAGTPPQASILCQHQGRLVTNDKTNLDRIHYSPVGDRTQWLGLGDSGAFDVGVGDGDPEGITGMVSFKGDLFIFKRSKMYRLSGSSPEDIVIERISDGVGCVSHNSIVTIDQDDVFWVSDKGVHSLAATANYGDFSSTYVSTDIQRTFNNDISHSRLKFIQAAYMPTINSVAFACSTASSSINDQVYLYNLPLKAWYRWPSISCDALVCANDADQKRLYFGTNVSRVAKAFNGTNYDLSTNGTRTAINLKITTGLIFPDNSPYNMKAFKRFLLFFKPTGSYNITVTLKIDNHPINSENSLSFSETSSSSLLGSTFTLGTSSLGYDVVLGAYTRMIDGYGRGVKIEITQSSVDSAVEIQGYGVEYEAAGTSPEVFLT